MKRKHSLALVWALSALLGVPAWGASSPNYQSESQDTDSGNAAITSPSYETAVSIGKSVVGITSANYSAEIGTIAVISAAPDITVTESDGSTNVVERGTTDSYEIALSLEPLADVVITAGTDGQTAVGPPTLTFTPANWMTPQTFIVTAVVDAVAEGQHWSTITHSVSSLDWNYDAIAIADVAANVSDTGVTIAATQPNAAEPATPTTPATPGEFTVTRGAPLTADLVVNLSIFGTATADVDYTAILTPVTIPAGQASQTIAVTPSYDAEVEGPETVTVLLTAGPDYAVALPNMATVTIADDDLPAVNISISDADASESGNSAALLISRNGPMTADLVVNLVITGTATEGVDFELIYGTATILDGTVTIPAEQSSVAVAVSPLDDDDAEGDETVTVAIASGPGYEVGSSSSVTVTITDDEIGLAGGGGCGGCEVPATGTGESMHFSAIFGMLLPYLLLIGVVRRRRFQCAFRILGLGTPNVLDGGRAPILQNHLGGQVNPYAAPFRR